MSSSDSDLWKKGVPIHHKDDPDISAWLRFIEDDQLIQAVFGIGNPFCGKVGEHKFVVGDKEGRIGIAFDGQACLVFVPDDGSPILEYEPQLGMGWIEAGWYL